MWAPSRAAFFLPWASLSAPLLDSLLLPFEGAFLWLLMTPVQSVHQAPDVISVVAHAKLATDDLCDARRGPDVRIVAVCQWPFQQYLHQTTPLGGLELQRTSG